MVEQIEPASGINWGDVQVQAKEAVGVVGKLAKTSRKITSFVKAITPTSKGAVKVVSATKLLAILPGFLAIIDFFQSLYSVYKTTGKARAHAVYNTIDKGKEVVSCAIDTAEGLETVGTVAKGAIKWTPLAATALLPLEAVALGTAIYDTHKVHAFKKRLETVPAPTRPTLTGRSSAARASLELLVEKEDEKSLQKKLGLSPKLPVVEKIKSVIRKIDLAPREAKTVEEAEKLASDLKTRVKKKLFFDVLGLVSRIFAVATVILLIISPLAPIFLGLAALAAIIGTGIYFWQKRALPAHMPELIRV